MRIVDLTLDFSEIVKKSKYTIDFKAKFWAWLNSQRRRGPLVPLLSDMERHWSTVGQAPSLTEARDIVSQLTPGEYQERIEAIVRHAKSLMGDLPEIDIVLLAGLERPEGYSRFERGRNTIFLGLDHPDALAQQDHLEIILTHELCHAVRDPSELVLADYGGSLDMSHDDFVARHPFREHLVSESLATSISKAAYPGRPDRRYVYFDEESIRWCENNRKVVADRMLLALERHEPYRTFYSENSTAPGSPESCDYWFGLHFGSFALRFESASKLLHMSSTDILARFLSPFLEEFVNSSSVLNIDSQALHDFPLVCAQESFGSEGLPKQVCEVYERYSNLLAKQPNLANNFDMELARLVSAEGVRFGSEALALHAFPLLLTADDEDHCRWVVHGILRLIERVIEIYQVNPEVRAFFNFPRHLEELCLLESGYRPHVALGRFDSYWSCSGLRFLELNVNGTAGWKVSDIVNQRALEVPILGEFLEENGAFASPMSSRILDGILNAWTQARG
ncbi:MAG: hypothetical protein KDD53_08265, partial [Bdellovibrionales bacterium]|nr:hypothetical protein [Bdellovibrionales bacterium]